MGNARRWNAPKTRGARLLATAARPRGPPAAWTCDRTGPLLARLHDQQRGAGGDLVAGADGDLDDDPGDGRGNVEDPLGVEELEHGLAFADGLAGAVVDGAHGRGLREVLEVLRQTKLDAGQESSRRVIVRL